MATSEHNAGARPPASSAAAPAGGPAADAIRRGSRSGWTWLSALALLTIAGYLTATRLIGVRATPAEASAAAPHPAVPVTVARSIRGNLDVYLDGLGSVSAFYTVTLKSRVDGELVKVAFTEGQFVKAGQLLARIDPRPYQVQLLQAQGQLEKDQAALADAQITLERDERLYASNVIARQDLDNQRASLGEYQGAVTSDRGAIASAKLNLTYCRITAPITGRIGLRLVDPGNIVHASDTQGLAVITQLQPIAVLFSIPEDNLPEVARAMRRGPLAVEAWDRSFSDQLAVGTLLTTNNQIDQGTGTIKLKAIFSNPDNMLFPNQFVNVKLLVGSLRDVVLAPTAALQKSPRGSFVYVVDPHDTVVTRPVTVRAAQGGLSAIATGLAPGEMVVIEGVDKLRDGARVRARMASNALAESGAP